MPKKPLIAFENSYSQLPEAFYTRIDPIPVAKPAMIRLNQELAEALGMDAATLDGDTGAAIFGGNSIAEGSEPLAMAYAGHQFGHFNPQLGDGRAILLGEVPDSDGQRWDMQLKGSGPTPYSRGGDGRAALGPVLREYILCEYMHTVGIPTTRALAAVTTGEEVVRDRLLPGAIITRMSRSFVRVGTFEFFASRGNIEALQQLQDYVIERNYPTVKDCDDPPWLALLDAVMDRQAILIAQWMQLGFIHGVMNTDNMSIAGETIDYGPCAFMDHYQADKVYSSIDRNGRYAYNNQPKIALWDLTRFAETLLPLAEGELDDNIKRAEELLKSFPGSYEQHWLQGMCAKLGLKKAHEDDRKLVERLLELMQEQGVDFTQTFRALSYIDQKAGKQDLQLQYLFGGSHSIDQWLLKWRHRLQQEQRSNADRQADMQSINPLYIPRNHLIEACIRAAEDHNDFAPFNELVDVLQQPYTEQAQKEKFTLPPRPEEVVQQTFCGT